MTKYKGKLLHWDVVNEIFNEDGTWRNSVFYKTLGEDFVAIAFNKARAVDPSVKLYINDYNTDAINAKSTALYNLVKKLVAQGVPIDGVGFQSHIIVGQVPTDYQANFERFAVLGVDVAITELDIRTNTPATAAALAQQEIDYKNAVLACVNVPKCVGITVWGFTDKHSWIPTTFPGEGAALPYSDCYKPKPAYNGIVAALGGTPVTADATCPTASSGGIPTSAQKIHTGTGGVATGWSDWSYETKNDFYSTSGPAPLSGDTNLNSTTTAGNYGIVSFKGSTTNFQGMADFIVYAAADFPFSLGLSATSENYYNSPTRPSSAICESTPTASNFVKCTLNIPELEAEAGQHAWDRIMIWTNKVGPQTMYLSSIYLAPAGATAEVIAPPADSAVIYAGNGPVQGWGDWSWACTNNAYFAGPPKPLVGDYVFQGTSNAGNYGGISLKGSVEAFQGKKKVVFYAAADPNSSAAPNWTFRFEATKENYFASKEYPFSSICASTLSSTSWTRCELDLDTFLADNGQHAWDRIDFMSKVNTGQTLYLGYIWAEPPATTNTCPTVTTATHTATSVITVTEPAETFTNTVTTTASAVTIVAPGATITQTSTAAAVTITNTATATVTTVTTATPAPCPKRKACNGKYVDISCCDAGTMCVKNILNDWAKTEYWNCVNYGGGLLDILRR